MSEINVKLKCWSCEGSKVYFPPSGAPEIPCPYCEGKGYTDAFLILDITDITDKLNDIFDKVNDIKEKVDEIFEKVKK